MPLAADAVSGLRPRYSSTVTISFVFVAIAAVCLFFADVSISTVDPWSEIKRMVWGALTPDFLAVETIGKAILQTVAFALVGVALAAVSGFVLAQFFHLGPVRWACAFARSIHELFWALIFLQMLGLSPLTGVLAIAIPFAGICAKVYAETLEEAQPLALKALPGNASTISTFFYVRLPDAWVHIKNYTGY
ncbi:MAG: ABC transporter permease, partial [Sedimenticolaceae bacterium]